jgi:hypothetical protein
VVTLWLFGRADNALSLADRFTAVFLLDVDHSTAQQRMQNPGRGNDYGRVGATATAAGMAADQFRRTWLERGAVLIDANHPVDAVSEQLLVAAARCSNRSSIPWARGNEQPRP